MSHNAISGFSRIKEDMGTCEGLEKKEDERGVYWERPIEVAQSIRRKLEQSRIKKLLSIHARSKH